MATDSPEHLLQRFVEKVNQVEAAVDVNQLWYRDVQVWPLIRCYLAASVFNPDKKLIVKKSFLDKKEDSMPETSVQDLLEVGNLSSSGNFSPIENFKYERNAPVLFSRKSTSVLFNGQYFDSILDPLLESDVLNHRGMKMEFLEPGAEKKLPRKNNILFIKLNRLKDVSWESLSNYSPSKEWGTLFSELKEAVSRIIQFDIDELFFRFRAENIHCLSNLVQLMFQKIQPNVVFLSKTFNVNAMSVIHACKKLNIPCVDVQHGIQGIHSLTYTHWHCPPPEGYQLLPKFYWVWSHRNVQKIVSTRPNGTVYPKPVIGGNLWISRWMTRPVGSMDPEHEQFLQLLKNYRRVVLVTLNWVKNSIPPELIQAVKDSPQDWFWMMRGHPMHKEKGIIQSLLDDNRIQNADTKKSSEYPLYLLLENCHHHVTCWSSVACEAMQFKVWTTLCHPIGKNLFNREIEEGLLLYASTSEEILNSIENHSVPMTIQPDPPYFETDLDTARKAYAFICSHKVEKENN